MSMVRQKLHGAEMGHVVADEVVVERRIDINVGNETLVPILHVDTESVSEIVPEVGEKPDVDT